MNNNKQSPTKRPISDRQPRQQFGTLSHQTNTCHAILDDRKAFVAGMTSAAPHLITGRFRLLGLALLMLAGLLFADEQ
jgi:hypothetical protein